MILPRLFYRHPLLLTTQLQTRLLRQNKLICQNTKLLSHSCARQALKTTTMTCLFFSLASQKPCSQYQIFKIHCKSIFGCMYPTIPPSGYNICHRVITSAHHIKVAIPSATYGKNISHYTLATTSANINTINKWQ